MIAWKPIPGYLNCLVTTMPNESYTTSLSHLNLCILATRGKKSISKEKNWSVEGIQAIRYFLLVQVLVFLPGSTSGSSITLLNDFQRASCPYLCARTLTLSHEIVTKETVCFSVFWGILISLGLPKEEPCMVPAPQRHSMLGAAGSKARTSSPAHLFCSCV